MAKDGTNRGRPKGSYNAETLDRMEMRKQFQKRVAERFGPLMDAQIDLARGIFHLVAKDLTTGQFVRVTDPVEIDKVLAGYDPETKTSDWKRGRKYWRIYARNPDGRALENVMDRAMGKPMQALEVTGAEGGPIEIVQRLQAARARAK